MKWHLAPAAGLIICALPRLAGAQDSATDQLFKLDGRSRAQIEALLDSAKQAGLPWTLVRSKALEGITKKVDGPKIVVTVHQYYTMLAKSRDVLGPLGPTDLDAGAAALTAGLRPEELALFRPAASGGRSPAGALIYLADLIGAKHGVPHDDAVTAFAKLWKDGAGDADFYGLWHGIDQDILSGVSPKTALQSQLRRLPARSARPPSEQNQENPHS
jgi:hypothetical protein